MASSGRLRRGKEEKDATPQQFRRFDVVTDDSDHHYHDTNKKKNCFTNTSSPVHKKIMTEWKILKKNLPESIYVRVYENRINLLRAVIVGSPGTPYYGSLFFFDITFPPNYPTQPPQVHYNSFGLRINPNLYANGYVCLSLLNTWTGAKVEKWDPSKSTILQVLVSIQGLVLNDKPYFNEPGTTHNATELQKSKEYNENVFIMSCKTMVYLLKKPPKNFEDFVTSHFRNNARGILTTCNAYIIGVMSESISSSSGWIDVSWNSKEMMKSWYPNMVKSFQETGAPLEKKFVDPMRARKKKSSLHSKKVIVKSNNNSWSKMAEKVIELIKKIFGF